MAALVALCSTLWIFPRKDYVAAHPTPRLSLIHIYLKLYLPLGAGDSAIAYGSFINAVIQFVIIAFVVFLMVKALNKARSLAKHGKQAEEERAPHCPYCLEEVAEGATRCPHCTAELPEPAGLSAKA